jgi:hypothetical protein
MRIEREVIITNPFVDLYKWVKTSTISAISKINFRLAKADAIQKCKQDNRKYYVIQSSQTNWSVFSTSDIQLLKRRMVFKKTLTAKEMTEKSAFVAYPDNYKLKYKK